MSDNLAAICDAINSKNLEIAKIEAKAAEKTAPLKSEVKDLENTLMSLMDAAGLKSIKGSRSEANIKDAERVQIVDFEDLTPFLIRHKAFHLFERRIALTAYREMLESRKGKEIPGLRLVKIPKINVKPTR